jgi:hypothetical protein
VAPTTNAPAATLPPNGPPTPPPIIPAQPNFGENATITAVYVIIEFDDSPRDIGWFIADEAYEEFRVGVPYGAYDTDQEEVTEVVNLEAGKRYMFTIEDLRGNGLSGGSSGGTYQIKLGDEDGGAELVSGGGDFGSDETSYFEVPPKSK